MSSIAVPAGFNVLLRETSINFDEAETADVIRKLKKLYPDRCGLFNQYDLYGALEQIYLSGAMDSDKNTKLLEILAEKTSKKDQLLILINGCDDVNEIIELITRSGDSELNSFGESRVGKTTLVKEISNHLKDFETFFIDLRDIKDMKAVYFLVLQDIHLTAMDYSKERIYEHFGNLAKKTLLILDNIEQFLSTDSKADKEIRVEFLEFLKVIIGTEASKRGHLKVILTSITEIPELSLLELLLKGNLFAEHEIVPVCKDASKTFIRKIAIKDVSSKDLQDQALIKTGIFYDILYLQMFKEQWCTPVQVLDKTTTQIEKGVPKEFACISTLFDAIPSDQLKQVAVKISLLRCPFSVSTAIKIAEISSDHNAKCALEVLVRHKIITVKDVKGKRKYISSPLFQFFVKSHLICNELPSFHESYKRGQRKFFEYFSGKLTQLANCLETDFFKTLAKLEKNKANFEQTLDISFEYEDAFGLLLHFEDHKMFIMIGILLEVIKDAKERQDVYEKWADSAEKKELWLASALMRCWQSIQGGAMEGKKCAESVLEMANESIKKAQQKASHEQVKEVESLFLHCSGKLKWMQATKLARVQRQNKDAQKNLKEGICDLQQAIAMREEFMGDNTLTCRGLNLIGNCYMELEDPLKAKEFYEKAMEMKKRLVGSEKHWEFPTFLNQIALVHECLGRKKGQWWRLSFGQMYARKKYRLAVKLLKKALALQEELGVREAEHTAMFNRNLANILIGLKEYDKALEYAQKCYEIRMKCLGQHPETVRILYLIGIIHEWRKDHNEALQNYEKAFEMEESLPADNHSAVRKLLCERLLEMCKKTKRKDKLKEYRPII